MCVDKEVKVNVLKTLESMILELDDGGTVPEPVCGICYNVNHQYDTKQQLLVMRWLATHYESWEHFSGDSSYPVPRCYNSKSTFSDMTMYHDTENMWVGEYGALRIDLCRHLIKEINKGLK